MNILNDLLNNKKFNYIDVHQDCKFGYYNYGNKLILVNKSTGEADAYGCCKSVVGDSLYRRMLKNLKHWDEDDKTVLKLLLYPTLMVINNDIKVINDLYDIVLMLEDFTLRNYDSYISNNDIKDNGDINIAYTTHDYKSVEDVEINVIFNIIDKTVKTVFTLYKDFNNNSYYANFCVYECEFATIKDIGRYFEGLEFDDLTCYSCEFEELVGQQAPNWQLITTK